MGAIERTEEAIKLLHSYVMIVENSHRRRHEVRRSTVVMVTHQLMRTRVRMNQDEMKRWWRWKWLRCSVQFLLMAVEVFYLLQWPGTISKVSNKHPKHPKHLNGLVSEEAQ